MTQRSMLAHSMLWATAILASALLHAPTFLSLLVLPGLATMALLSDYKPAAQSADRGRGC